jgi:sarcosine oxidase subunit gamma
LPGATLCDVSHGRVAVRVSGADVRAALAKGCMLDLHPREFGPGACAQTVVARMNVIVHRRPTGDENDGDEKDEAIFDLYVARSYARSFWHWLTEAADEYGCAVARGPQQR